MNEPETLALRKARQFARLQRLGELAMAVAETAAKATIDAYDQPAPEDEQHGPTPAPRSPAAEHALTFARAARIVRDITGLEMRLDRPDRPSLFRPYDPRRSLLRGVLHEAVAHEPDSPQRCREINDRIEKSLADDPAAAIPLDRILAKLCDDLDLEVDITRVPDVFLGIVKPPGRSNL